MGIFRSTDPTVYDDLDGIVIDETAPPPSIQGASSNVAILVGQFERGPLTLESVGSIGVLRETYGNNSSYSGLQSLKAKKFGQLKVIRCAASGAAKATYTFDDGAGSPTDIIKFDAKYKGVYGNSITVTIEDGSTSGKKYTIKDNTANAVLPTEVYDNIVITAVTAATFADSMLVDVTVMATTAEPDDATATNLASGSDGTIADTDYETAIALAGVEGAGNILFLDDYNDTRNGYLKTHAADTQDKMVICANSESATTATAVSDAITDVGTLRDSDGRIIYAFNAPYTFIDGVETETSPAAWMASILSQTSPHIDPAYAANTQYLAGITKLKHSLKRSQYIALKDAGIAAFEFDGDIGVKVKSGVVTQIANSSKVTILRRRMADFLTTSGGRFLKNYQNAVNSKDNRDNVNAAIRAFVASQENIGILPKDSEVKSGLAKLVDTESLNTDLTIGQGKFFVLWKQRIYSSMRFIVLKAEIGETVVVSES